MKFDFSKSSSEDKDFQNKFQYIYKRLDLVLKIARYNNELLIKLVNRETNNQKIQTELDKYYDEHESSELEDK